MGKAKWHSLKPIQSEQNKPLWRKSKQRWMRSQVPPNCDQLRFMTFDFIAQRVLGALMEKEMTTPEQYPLSLNALVNACNQKSSRDPVLSLSEDEVRAALDMLEGLTLVATVRESRVLRFEHRIRTVLQLRRDETAIVCLLLLRGPQTAGDLRSRSDRMFTFDDLAQVQTTLERLAARPEPLTTALARSSGSREVRWRHLLGDEAGANHIQPGMEQPPSATPDAWSEAIADLQRRVERLEALLESRP